MADDLNKKPESGDVAPQDIAANNAEVKAKLESQDISGHSTAGHDDPLFDSGASALDKLRDAAEKKAEEDTTGDGTPKPDEGKAKPVVVPKPDAAVKPDAAAKPDDAAKGDTGVKPDDIFRDVQLPPGARPKSAEAFGQIKARATQEISERDKRIEQLQKDIADRDAKLQSPVPAETLAELKELREFRAKFDIEADPKFKSFDTTISQSHEFIYAQMRKNPNITEDVITQIKKYNGPENVQMAKLFEVMQDPTAQRLIEGRLADIELQKFNKAQAQEEAKKNVSGYIAERQKQFEENRTGHNTATKRELDSILAKLDWMKTKTSDAKATDADKAAVAGHNKFVADMNQQLTNALADDSPEMRGVMLAGMAQLFYLQDRHDALKAKEKALSQENEKLRVKLEKFTGASITRLEESGASPAKTELKMSKDIFSARAADSLDAIRDRIIAERQRADAQ